MGLGEKPFENIVGKGEIACTINFSFSYNVFYPVKDRNYHLCYIYFVICKCFQFGQSQIFVTWEWVKNLWNVVTCMLHLCVLLHLIAGGYKKQPAAKQNTSNKIDGSVNIPTQPQSVLSRRKGNISQEQGKQSQSSERYVPESKSLERRDSQSQSRKPSQNNAYPYTSYKAPPGCVAGEFECVLSPKHMLYVYTVEITQKLTDVDMIACGETEGGDSTGKVTKAIESMFGEKFIQEKKLKFKKAKEGDIVIVRTGQNVIEYVAHVILYQKINTASESDRKEKMSELYKKLFVKMKDKKCRGVALPVLGTGIVYLFYL